MASEYGLSELGKVEWGQSQSFYTHFHVQISDEQLSVSSSLLYAINKEQLDERNQFDYAVGKEGGHTFYVHYHHHKQPSSVTMLLGKGYLVTGMSANVPYSVCQDGILIEVGKRPITVTLKTTTPSHHATTPPSLPVDAIRPMEKTGTGTMGYRRSRQQTKRHNHQTVDRVIHEAIAKYMSSFIPSYLEQVDKWLACIDVAADVIGVDYPTHISEMVTAFHTFQVLTKFIEWCTGRNVVIEKVEDGVLTLSSGSTVHWKSGVPSFETIAVPTTNSYHVTYVFYEMGLVILVLAGHSGVGKSVSIVNVEQYWKQLDRVCDGQWELGKGIVVPESEWVHWVLLGTVVRSEE